MIETDGIRCGKLMMTMLYFPRKTSFIKQSSNCALVCQKLVVASANELPLFIFIASAPHLHRSSAACFVISSHRCQSLSDDLVPVTKLSLGSQSYIRQRVTVQQTSTQSLI